MAKKRTIHYVDFQPAPWLQNCPHCGTLLDLRSFPQDRRRRKAPCCGKLIRLIDE